MSMNDAISPDAPVPALTLTNPEDQESYCSSRRTSTEPLDGNHDSLLMGDDLMNDGGGSDSQLASSGEFNDSFSYPSDRSNRSQRSSYSNIQQQQQQQSRKRNKFWYHALTTTYKHKHQDFRRLFYGTPVSENERLLVDFACALSKATNGLLLQGRMYITINWICFYSKIIAYETKLTLDVRSISSLTKERTARVFPNAIQIAMERGDKYFFTSFASRDRTFHILNRVVQSVQSGAVVSDEDFWEQVHEAYGDDLGLDSSEEVDLEYCCPPGRRPAEHRLAEPTSSDPPPNVDLEERPIKEDEDEEDDDVDEEDEDEEVDEDDEDDETCTNSDIGPLGRHSINGIGDGKNASVVSDGLEMIVNGFHSTLGDDEGVRLDTEEDEKEEDIECKGHSHLENEYLNVVIPMPLETVFTCLFTDSPFFKRVTSRQRTFAVTQSAWPEDPDENGEKERTIYYTLRLSNALGPKTSPTVEKQILLRPAYIEDERRQITVDAKVRNGGVPYCDSFHCVNRYCLSRRSPKRTGLRVTSCVVYDKSIFYPAKRLIENTAKKGLGDYFEMIHNFLIEEASGKSSLTRVAPLGTRSNLNRQGTRKQKRADGRRRRDDSSMDRESDGKLLSTRRRKSLGRTGFGTSLVNLILNPERSWQSVIVIGLLLCLVFAVLYSKFLDVERITNDLYAGETGRDPAGFPGNTREKALPQFSSAHDWASLLKHQDSVHRSELKRWRAVVDGTVTLMEEMRASLLRLRDTLDSLEKMPSTSSSSSSSSPAYAPTEKDHRGQ